MVSVMAVLAVILIAIFFLKILSVVLSTDSSAVTPQKFSTVIKHGHRCYADGLNNSEVEVVRLLSQNLSHKDYFIFNNLIIPSDNSKSTQIDHVVVSRFGIFVIETKECNGWIYPHSTREQWAVTYPNGEKHHMPNPIWQNYGHIQSLNKALPFAEGCIHGVIVYVGITEFKTPRISNVVLINELLEVIRKYSVPTLSEQRLLMAIGKLSYMCQAVDITPDQHVENIKQIISAKTR